MSFDFWSRVKGHEEKNNRHFVLQDKVSTFHFELWCISHLGGSIDQGGWSQYWARSQAMCYSHSHPLEDNLQLLECKSVCRISVSYSWGHFSRVLFHYHLCCDVNRKTASLWVWLIAGGITWYCCRYKSDISLVRLWPFHCPTAQHCQSVPQPQSQLQTWLWLWFID